MMANVQTEAQEEHETDVILQRWVCTCSCASWIICSNVPLFLNSFCCQNAFLRYNTRFCPSRPCCHVIDGLTSDLGLDPDWQQGPQKRVKIPRKGAKQISVLAESWKTAETIGLWGEFVSLVSACHAAHSVSMIIVARFCKQAGFF